MPDEKKPDEKKQRYRISGSAFRFRGKTYPEGSEVELTKEEYNADKKKINLTLVKKEG